MAFSLSRFHFITALFDQNSRNDYGINNFIVRINGKQWDQIGQFLQVRGKILNKKLAQIFADFGAILKSSL